MNDRYQINSEEELWEVIIKSKRQDQALAERLYDHIDEYAQSFIADSPVVFFATADNRGHVDVSVKGDAPGFIEFVDSKTLVFPERKGNTDARNLRNILQNDQVSLLFAIPRTKDVLRVTGRATITKDPALLERMVSCGKPALLCIKIHVQECFFHCARAFNRCHMWNPEKWPVSEKHHKRNQMAHRKNMSAKDVEEFSKQVKQYFVEMGESDGAY